jgi:hypothetical protein
MKSRLLTTFAVLGLLAGAAASGRNRHSGARCCLYRLCLFRQQR